MNPSPAQWALHFRTSFLFSAPDSPESSSCRVFKPHQTTLRHTVGEAKERQGGAAGKVHLFLLLDLTRVMADLFSWGSRAISSTVLAWWFFFRVWIRRFTRLFRWIGLWLRTVARGDTLICRDLAARPLLHLMTPEISSKSVPRICSAGDDLD